MTALLVLLLPATFFGLVAKTIHLVHQHEKDRVLREATAVVEEAPSLQHQ